VLASRCNFYKEKYSHGDAFGTAKLHAKSPEETYLKIVLPKALKEQFKMQSPAENKTITDYLIHLMTITTENHQELIQEVNGLCSKKKTRDE
jgi:hypothetical protein